jgi:hypothetical protein
MIKRVFNLKNFLSLTFLVLFIFAFSTEKAFLNENITNKLGNSKIHPSITSMSPIFIDDTNPDYNWSKTAAENDWITGNGTWNNPYLIKGLDFVSISNKSAISIQNSQVAFIIRDCLFFNCLSDGIDLDYVSNGNISDNIFINGSSTDSYRISITMRYCENISILNNNFYYEGYESMLLLHGSMLNVHANKAFQSKSYFYFGDVDQSSFTGNSIRMRFVGCHHNEIKDNILINIISPTKESGNGLYFASSDYNNISSNVMYSYFGPLSLENECDHNVISMNNLSGYRGIYFWSGGSFNMITHNRIEFFDDEDDLVGGWTGISIASESVNNSLLFNYISHFSIAVVLARPSNVVHAKYCTVMNNTFFQVGECIDYDKSDGHVIKDNVCILYQTPPVTIPGYSAFLCILISSMIGMLLSLRRRIEF